jgi:hypothetical protein
MLWLIFTLTYWIPDRTFFNLKGFAKSYKMTFRVKKNPGKSTYRICKKFLTVLRETLKQYISLRGVCTLVLSWLFQGGSITGVYCRISLLCWQGLLLYTVTLYNFSCNGNGRENYLGPFSCDVLYRPLCEDSDTTRDHTQLDLAVNF